MPCILSLSWSVSFVLTRVVAYMGLYPLFQIRAHYLTFSSLPFVPIDHKVDLGVGATVNRVFYGRRHVCAIFNGGSVKVRIARSTPHIPAICFTTISPYTSGTHVSFQCIHTLVETTFQVFSWADRRWKFLGTK